MDSSGYSPRSPFHSGPSTASPLSRNSPRSNTTTHLRQRSINLEKGLPVPSPTDSVFSNADTVVELGEDDGYDVEEKGKRSRYTSVSLDEEEADCSTGNVGYKSWSDQKRQNGRRCGARLCCLAVFFAVGTAGWTIGYSARHPLEVLSTARDANYNGGLRGATEVCNPYEQHGVLLVNTTVPSENRWAPISAPESCQPVDFTKLIHDSATGIPSEAIDFARNRILVFFGDSVDRDHNEHLCTFFSGVHEMIGVDHPFSPPYPEGRELPPEDYSNHWTGEREWPNFDQSRPFICHVERLNLRILNVFHYGFLDVDDWIQHHAHFYPPGKIEDRFDQIVVPIVAAIAKKYKVDAIPDIVSITSGFWGMLRLAVEEDAARDKEIAGGLSPMQALYKFDTFNNMNQKKRDWLEKRTREVLRHVAKGWRKEAEEKDMGEVQRKPQILWRALHHIKEHHNIPYDRVQSLDQIGRSVIERLIAEGRAAAAGQVRWATWSRKAKEALGFKAERMPETEWQAQRGGLGERLKVDNWGQRILGQEARHFRDDVHPLPLPCSYLYGNMLMQNLKEAVDRWQRKTQMWWEMDSPQV